MGKHYCYMIKANQHVKIGYTKDVDKRLRSMQTGNPYVLEVLALFPFETELSARGFEKNMHRRYKRFHMNGEWFFVEPVLKWMREHGDMAPADEYDELELVANSPL